VFEVKYTYIPWTLEDLEKEVVKNLYHTNVRTIGRIYIYLDGWKMKCSKYICFHPLKIWTSSHLKVNTKWEHSLIGFVVNYNKEIITIKRYQFSNIWALSKPSLKPL